MFGSRRAKSTPLPAPTDLDFAWFSGFAQAARPHLQADEKASLSALVSELPAEELRPALLVFTALVAPFSDRVTATRQPFLPWRSFTEAWGETSFHGFRSALAFRYAAEGPAFSVDRAISNLSEQEVGAAYHLFDELVANSYPMFKPREIEELKVRGLQPYILERWPGMPESYPLDIYRFDAQHKELQVATRGDYRSLIAILASETPTSPLWDFVRSYAANWNQRIENTLKAEPRAHSQASKGLIPPQEVLDPGVMGGFLDGAIALEVSGALARAYSTYQINREVSDCFREIRVLTTVVPKPTRVPVTLTLEVDSALIEVDVCKEELRQAPEMDLLVRIYLDRIASALEQLPYMHPSTRHVLTELRKPCSRTR